MTISELIKDLQKFKKEHGDVDVLSYDEDADYKYDEPHLKMLKLPFMNEDTGKVTKRTYKTCVISQEID